MNLKMTVKDVVGNLRNTIDDIEVCHNSAALTVHGCTPSGAVDLTEFHQDIDKLEDRMDKFEVDIHKLSGESSEPILYHNLGFGGSHKDNAWIEEHCPHEK